MAPAHFSPFVNLWPMKFGIWWKLWVSAFSYVSYLWSSSYVILSRDVLPMEYFFVFIIRGLVQNWINIEWSCWWWRNFIIEGSHLQENKINNISILIKVSSICLILVIVVNVIDGSSIFESISHLGEEESLDQDTEIVIHLCVEVVPVC